MSGASERANGRASGPVLQSVFLVDLAHSVAVALAVMVAMATAMMVAAFISTQTITVVLVAVFKAKISARKVFRPLHYLFV